MRAAFSLIFALIASATAAVIEVREPAATLEKRYELRIVMCKDLNMKGICTAINTANDGCYADFRLLTQQGGNWNDQVTSASIVPEMKDRRFSCTLYADLNCTGRSLTLTGVEYDLRTKNFNDIATSVKCRFY
ncbi:hypothetical protein HGRIS_000747 [Hohenbuehelia grisea]|uniref:Uncharacterized protein n=1 Tax=Hohenbuehelia grisea TaxID=104357 RepID=A0ABR3IPM1_9AGAR